MSNLTEIKAKDLGSVYISHEDVENVKTLAKTLKIKYTMGAIISSIFLFVTSVMLMPDIMTFNITMESCFMFILVIFFLLVLISLINSKKSVKDLTPTKAQYGKLKEKYIVNKIDEDGNKKYFYMDVEFPTTNTIIQKIETSRSIYHKSNLGDKILVVSFDCQKAYAMKSNSI